MTGEIATSVSVSGLSKSFRTKGARSVQVLNGVDLHVQAGESLVLLGPSGCGKTTLLRCLAGLERPDTGVIRFGDAAQVDSASRRFVPANRRDIGMVFQAYVLWPHMTVGENVAYPLKVRRLRAELKRGRVAEVLGMVHCTSLADRHPSQLSGGQQQRIGLARALAARPRLLLLDEPLSNLDTALRLDLRAQLRELHQTVGYTAIHVTHDQEEALSLGTRIALMREGRIEQIGTPEDVYRSPCSPYTAEFLGARNSATVWTQDGPRTAAGPVTGLRIPDGRLTAYIRPNRLRIVPLDAAPAGRGDEVHFEGARILDRSFSGSTREYLVAVGDDHWTVHCDLSSPPSRSGDAVRLACSREDLFLYDKDHRIVDGG